MIKVGDSVPKLPLITSEGERISLPDFKGEIVVLYFYPKDNTPGCTAQACSFRDNHEKFNQLNATIIGVSPDSKESHESFKEQHDLPYTLIVDEKHQLAEEFGVCKVKVKAGHEYYSNQRSTFVIDRSGIIKKAFLDVQVDGHVDEVLQAIKEID
nr:thioredoxin-dependent thiol peroxidase [Amphibacillus sp. MSJ-3]